MRDLSTADAQNALKYAGYYLPALSAVITSQNERIAKVKIDKRINKPINLRSAGIINGYVDYL